ncbi:MAG: hypothetical protein IT440_01300 [Phycisphaeraceae bacterium]|nr:hypothetical protein [Phycisphaeraceae bacterium]
MPMPMRSLRNLIHVGLLAALLTCVTTGCHGTSSMAPSTGRPVAGQENPSGGSGGWTWSKLNPFDWDWSKAGRDTREAMAFKIGDAWVISPPRTWSPTRIEVSRSVNQEELQLKAEVQAVAAATTQPATTQPASGQIQPATTTQAIESQAVPPAEKQTDKQVLVIDLNTGRGWLTDYDGRIYPQEYDSRVVAQLRVLSRQQQWMISQIKPVSRVAQPIYYHAVLFEGDNEVSPTVRWAVPARQSLPELQVLLSGTFDVAHRSAHPLSEYVNLLK